MGKNTRSSFSTQNTQGKLQIEEVPKETQAVVLTAPKTYGFGKNIVREPGEDEVVVKVNSTAINPTDIQLLKGMYNVKVSYPYTPGWEGSGVIVKVGSAKNAHRLGTKVGFLRPVETTHFSKLGAYADYCTTDSHLCIDMPEGVTFEQASQFVINPMTAIKMIEIIKERGARSVIISAAAANLGKMFIRLAQKNGITPVALVRRDEQVKILQDEIGLDHIINTSDDDYRDQLKKLARNVKLDACFECISGDLAGELLSYMSFRSTMLVYGNLSGQPFQNMNTLSVVGKEQKIEGYLVTNFFAEGNTPKWEKAVEEAKSLYKDILCTNIAGSYGLHEIDKAIDTYNQNQSAGRVIMKPELTK